MRGMSNEKRGAEEAPKVRVPVWTVEDFQVRNVKEEEEEED